MMALPGFAHLTEPEKYDEVIAIIEREHPEFVNEDPAYKHLQAQTILERAGQLCNPRDLENVSNPKGLTKEIPIAADVSDYEALEWLPSGGLLLLFCIPMIWYFVLDRIREISAAVSGRDHS